MSKLRPYKIIRNWNAINVIPRNAGRVGRSHVGRKKMKKKIKVFIILAIVIGAVAVPICIRYLKPYKEYACYKNLRRINEAILAAWSAEHYPFGTLISASVITRYMNVRVLPECPSGGKYSIRSLGELPTCSFHHGNLFNKYGTAREACINNLRMIEAGKEQILLYESGTNTESEKK